MKLILKRPGKSHNTIRWFSTLLVIIFAAALLFIRDYIPINVLSLPFDDELFVRRADVILKGELTTFTSGYNPLVKGVAYPWLLVITNILEVTPLIFVYVIFLISIYSLMFVLFTKQQIALVNFAFLFVLLDPSPLKGAASRIARESFYGLSVLILILGIFIYSKYLMKDRNISLVFGVAIFSGFWLFVAQNVREERAWVYLILIVSLLFPFMLSDALTKKFFIRYITFVVGILLSYVCFMLILKLSHDQVYDVPLTSSTIEGEFPKLLSNLSSIDVGKPDRPYVAVSIEKRMIAYEVSPEFRKLKDYLEGPGGMWIQFGCENSGICDDYANSYFHVALREAIKLEGFWENQKDAQLFMKSINDDLEKACKIGRIDCSRTLPLARGLGVTKITNSQISQAGGFFIYYIKLSISNWDFAFSAKDISFRFNENFYYTPISEESWKIWNQTVYGLDVKQSRYQDRYNYSIGRINNAIQSWNYIHSIVIKIALVTILILNLLLIFKHARPVIPIKILIITNIFIFFWLTRGLLLAFNSSTNLISINEYYSLPGRIFLSIGTSLALIVLSICITNIFMESRLRARRDSNP